MGNFDMKTREITDADLELASAAGAVGAYVGGILAAEVVAGLAGGGVGGAIAAAFSVGSASDTGSHLEDKVNER